VYDSSESHRGVAVSRSKGDDGPEQPERADGHD
jgi:hypothetical protein